MNISNFIEWFITQFVNIATNLIAKLDQIIIYANVSLLDFTITIAIIGMFINIILTIPTNVATQYDRIDRAKAKKERTKNDKK